MFVFKLLNSFFHIMMFLDIYKKVASVVTSWWGQEQPHPRGTGTGVGEDLKPQVKRRSIV